MIEVFKGDNLNISENIAYRFYFLQSGIRFIAFNTISRDYLFLEDLSAELLHHIIEIKNPNTLRSFCNDNEITKGEMDNFIDTLMKFGFFQIKSDEKDEYRSRAIRNSAEEEEYDPYLDDFQKLLHSNGLYYAFHLDLTHACNEKCVHCYHAFDTYDISKELTTKEVIKLIDIAFDIGVFSITLSGGECLLRNDFFEILDYIAGKGMLVTIFTNGMLLKDGLVKKLTKYPINMVSVSLYGDNSELHDSITQVVGSFEKSLDGIAVLKKYGINYELKSVILDKNVLQIENIRDYLKKLGDGSECRMDSFLLRKIDGSSDNLVEQASKEALRNLIQLDPEYYFDVSRAKRRMNDINETPCIAGRYSLYCNAYGEIYPCVSFRLLLCNYIDLPEINKNPILAKWLNTKICDFSDCFKHDYCDYCTEQCAGRNLLENGNYLDSKNITSCERAKLILEWYNSTYSNNKI